MNNSNNNDVLIFQSICLFIKDLYNEFVKDKPIHKYIEIELYNHLLEKTGLSNTIPIQKHIQGFKVFFEKNKEAMELLDVLKINEPVIRYSSKVFINIQSLLSSSSQETSLAIWKHLLYIWNQIDPSCVAKQLLKDTDDSCESVFITNMFDKVSQAVNTQNVSNSDNPMGIAMQLMSSGVFTDIMSGMSTEMSSGKFDMNKMFGSVTTLLTKLSPDGTVPLELTNMINMIKPMLNNNVNVINTVEDDEKSPMPKIEEIDE